MPLLASLSLLIQPHDVSVASLVLLQSKKVLWSH